MTTGYHLTGSKKVRKLQTMLHAKAKEEPERRFHALADKVWRMDFLQEAWVRVHRNGGSAGVDGERFADISARGVEAWLGELSRDLREGTYRPKPVRQVLIPKKQPGKFRPLGIPCIRDRVAQTSAMLVLEPIFEADLQPEQYGYRSKRSANDAVKRVHKLLNTGHNEVVDCDLSNYFGEIPHAELMTSIARRVSDGRMLGLIKAWLEMPVEEDDGEGGKRRTSRARRDRKGTPQGAPVTLFTQKVTFGLRVRLWGGEIIRRLTVGARGNTLMTNDTILSIRKGQTAQRRLRVAGPRPLSKRSRSPVISPFRDVSAPSWALCPRCTRHGPSGRAGRGIGPDHCQDSWHARNNPARPGPQPRSHHRGDRFAGTATLPFGARTPWLSVRPTGGLPFTSPIPSTACSMQSFITLTPS